MAFVILIMVLNFAISWWNATQVGKMWVESKFAGGWMRFMAWCGAAMAASGFTWCFLFILVFVGHGVAPDKITEEVMKVSIELGYIILIPVVLLSGYAITFESWARAWRERSALNMGIAGWNSFASVYNTYNAVKDFGGAFKDVSDFFSSSSSSKSRSKDENNAMAVILVIVLVAVALFGGILLTYAIIAKNAATARLDNPTPSVGRLEKRYGAA